MTKAMLQHALSQELPSQRLARHVSRWIARHVRKRIWRHRPLRVHADSKAMGQLANLWRSQTCQTLNVSAHPFLWRTENWDVTSLQAEQKTADLARADTSIGVNWRSAELEGLKGLLTD